MKRVPVIGERIAAKGRGLRRRVLTGILSAPPVRHRLHRRARAAWTRTDTLTFVCLGNICRSPFAEAVARAHADGQCVCSAGTFPTAGRSSPAAAVQAAADRSVDLVAHRSRVLDAEAVRGAGAIFVFDADNLLELWRTYPDARGRVHLLGALSMQGPLAVGDPYGGTPEEFAVAYDRIAALIGEAPAGAAPAR